MGIAQTVLLVNRAFVLCPKEGVFDENGENDELAFYPVKQGLCSSEPVKMTEMVGVTRAKAWFTKGMVFRSLRFLQCGCWPGNSQISDLIKSQEKGVLAKGVFAESSVTPKKAKIPKDVGPSSTFGTQSAAAKTVTPFYATSASPA